MQNRRILAAVVCFCSMALFAFRVDAEPAQNAAKKVTPDSVSKPADSLPLQAAVPQCTLTIKCDPAGAAVYIDDSLKGTAPLSITGIAPGNHMLTLKKKGFFLKKAEVTVDSTTAKELSFVLLQPGFLKVETMPSGADLWIDDKKEGTTPYETDRIKPGDHTVKVVLNKYAPQERPITISNGGRDSLKLVLDYTRAYKEEMAVAQATQEREHKERMYLGIVSGLFVLGALVLVIVEAMGQ